MIFPSANGTVSGFFYYADDANEVDFEFLSKAPDRFWAVIHHTGNLTTWPTLNVVKLTKTGESLAGKEVEVRFDHFPERVDYYINDVYVTGFSGPWVRFLNIPQSDPPHHHFNTNHRQHVQSISYFITSTSLSTAPQKTWFL
ncbi:hypothetical protein BKA69DRAFT_1104529, partial [Paraphysoderma sedebokerense]